MTEEKAFPRADGRYDSSQANEQGMTLRDYFAAKAMQGLMSTERANQYVSEVDGIEDEEYGGTLFVHTRFLAQESYMIADAMLKAREQ